MTPGMFYLLVVYMWAIGITTSVTQFVKPPPYRFSDTAVSLLFFAPMIGVLVAELWGHVVNDWLCNFFLRKNGGIHNPEIRLWAVYPAVIVGVASLVLYGQTLQHSLSWLGIAFGWGMNSFGMLAATTAVSAYILDVFPHHSALASAWSQFWRVTGKVPTTSKNKPPRRFADGLLQAASSSPTTTPNGWLKADPQWHLAVKRPFWRPPLPLLL